MPRNPKFAYIAPNVSSGNELKFKLEVGIKGNISFRPIQIEYKYIPSSTGGLLGYNDEGINPPKKPLNEEPYHNGFFEKYFSV